MTKINILFVCSANEDRSRTAEDLYKIHPRLKLGAAAVYQVSILISCSAFLEGAY